MKSTKSWEELKTSLAEATVEIESDQYENLDSLYQEIKGYFEHNNFSRKELDEAKEMIKLTEERISNKINSYNSELENNDHKKKGFIQYINNLNLPLG